MASYKPLLDRLYQLTGARTDANTTTTWTLPCYDAEVNTLILSDSGSFASADRGRVLSETGNAATGYVKSTNAAGQTTIKTNGNYSAADCIIGVSYTMTLTLGVPFSQTRNNNPEFASWRQIRWLDVSHLRSGPYTVSASKTYTTTRTWAFSDGNTDNAESTGKFRAHCNGDADNTTVQIIATTPKRVIISSAYFNMDVNTRRD